jgi:hypothetical protein
MIDFNSIQTVCLARHSQTEEARSGRANLKACSIRFILHLCGDSSKRICSDPVHVFELPVAWLRSKGPPLASYDAILAS